MSSTYLLSMTLREWRLEQKLTQADVAKKLGTDQAQVAKWELGTHSPTLESALKIQKITEGAVTPADLVRTAERG